MSATPPFLQSLSEAERARLLGGATSRRYAAGAVLLREGDAGSSLLLVTAGEVDVTRGGNDLARLGAGGAIGEMALLDPAPRSATVTARGPVEALELPRDVVWAFLAEGDPAAIKLLQALTAIACARLADVNRLVQEEVVRPRGSVFKRLLSSVFGK